MTIRKLYKLYKGMLWAGIASTFLFLSFAHHFLNYWEKPALIMIGMFILLVPILASAIFLISKLVKPNIFLIRRKQLIVTIIPTIIISLFISWRYYHAPNTYHSLTITPIISENQSVRLLELKAGGAVVSAEKKALESGWESVDGVLIATEASQPLSLSFKRATNTPFTLLFYTSPQGGNVIISSGIRRVKIDLYGPSDHQVLSTFFTEYRGIPNWLFIPLLVSIDTLTFSGILLTFLLIQAVGEKSLTKQGSLYPPSFNHRKNLIILLSLSLALHLLNALSVPLILDVDSPQYLEGAVHLVEFGNLDGIPMARGPGSTFLFAPIILLAGRNPWGMKVLLHLLAVACVPLAYRLGWQSSHKHRIAFMVGLVTTLLPDLFIYSNFVMADLPNIFFVLLFSTLLISALETPRLSWIFSAMLTGSFAALLRPENIVLLIISILFLVGTPSYRLLAKALKKNVAGRQSPVHNLLVVGLSIGVAILPLLWWSAHNYKVHGFFGLSNYSGAAWYEGWVFWGDAKGFAFSDPASSAVQQIQAAIEQYPIIITDHSGVATSTEIFPSLIKAGYSIEQAYELYRRAAWDSIAKDWELTLKLLTHKFGRAFIPETTHLQTFPLPGEKTEQGEIKSLYFDQETLSIPILINTQRILYNYMQKWYDTVYPAWIWVCVFALFFGLYRSPTNRWLTMVLITATRIFIPLIISVPYWRYTLAGLVLLQVFAVNWIATLLYGGRAMFQKNISLDS